MAWPALAGCGPSAWAEIAAPEQTVMFAVRSGSDRHSVNVSETRTGLCQWRMSSRLANTIPTSPAMSGAVRQQVGQDSQRWAVDGSGDINNTSQ